MPASESSVHPLNQPIVAEFRANRGIVGGPFAGADLLLLITEGVERDALFAMITDRAPGYRDYQSRAQRTLPVVALIPAQQQDSQ